MAKKAKKTTAAKAAVGKAKKTTSRRAAAPKPPSKVGASSTKEKINLIDKLIALLKRKRAELAPPKSNRLKAKNEYRYNHDTQHTMFVFGETEDEYRAIGFTHREETFGRKNMPLIKNPKRGDNRPSYARNGIIADSKRSFSKKKAKNYQISEEDMPNIKSKARHYKKEQKRAKKKKDKKNE